ncbi:DUF6082 family protein [Streptomyces sp. NPDC056632]|uniref:DUF6082 family protein n=1 Tax=Streptomyces sp. NPDC056632 TaxID=3345884 RepID=UPI0036A39257
MKPSTAILVAAAAVATVTTLSAERRHRETMRLAKEQHRQRLELGVAGLHQQLLADAAADSEQWEIWGKGERTPEETRRTIKVNRQVCLTQLTHTLELVSLDELLVRARALMERPAVRKFWTETRDFRSRETQTPESSAFISVLDRELAAATRKASAADEVAAEVSS